MALTLSAAMMFEELKSPFFWKSAVVGAISGLVAAVLKIMDDQTYLGISFLNSWLPELLVFNGFMIFASLVASFRTAHALQRYQEAAVYMYKLHGCWFDATSSLIAFCRHSDAATKKIDKFQHTLIRLISALTALCFEDLTRGLTGQEETKRGRMRTREFKLDVLDLHVLDDETQGAMYNAACAPEMLFQSIQHLVVESMQDESDGSPPVLSIPPPILTRSFQELGSGMLVYHEAKKLSHIPIPRIYEFIALVILICEACFAPFMLANACPGPYSSFFFTFFATTLLWLLNGVADMLNNPFERRANTLDAAHMQQELNLNLAQLLDRAWATTPYVTAIGQTSLDDSMTYVLEQHSLVSWKKNKAAQDDEGESASRNLTPQRVVLRHRQSLRVSSLDHSVTSMAVYRHGRDNVSGPDGVADEHDHGDQSQPVPGWNSSCSDDPGGPPQSAGAGASATGDGGGGSGAGAVQREGSGGSCRAAVPVPGEREFAVRGAEFNRGSALRSSS